MNKNNKKKLKIMKKQEEKAIKTEVVLETVNLKHLKVEDIILIEDDIDGVEYKVLDIGFPFILIQNLETRFAHLYEPKNNLYKKIVKKQC